MKRIYIGRFFFMVLWCGSCLLREGTAPMRGGFISYEKKSHPTAVIFQ